MNANESKNDTNRPAVDGPASVAILLCIIAVIVMAPAVLLTVAEVREAREFDRMITDQYEPLLP